MELVNSNRIIQMYYIYSCVVYIGIFDGAYTFSVPREPRIAASAVIFTPATDTAPSGLLAAPRRRLV